MTKSGRFPPPRGGRGRRPAGDGSLAAHLARSALKIPSHARLKKAAQECMAPLAKSGYARRLTAQMRAKGKAAAGHKARRGPATFWSSQTAHMRMTKKELEQLPAEVDGIRAIYKNRRLRPPRVVRPRDLPRNILENGTSAWGVHAVNALAAWGAYSATGDGVTVGVLDTGVDATHPDLAGKVTAFAEFDADGLQVPGATARDSDEHGTHVCGTIAGDPDGPPDRQVEELGEDGQDHRYGFGRIDALAAIGLAFEQGF